MIKYHENLIQGSDEWRAARCGLLTASEMKLIITPTLKIASNEKERNHLYELAGQRITNYVEPSYISDDMLRGMDDESYARETYNDNYSAVDICGFVTNDEWGFTLGCSPDGLVGETKGIEAKSRKQKFQIETILSGEMPEDYKIQVQTCMLVTGRPEWDYISYCGGLPMKVISVKADKVVHDAIIAAATIFHEKLDKIIKEWPEKIKGLIETKRIPKDITA